MGERELLVVSDLDGCLLDAETYSYDAARPALAALERLARPLVLCSSKTRAEMEVLVRALRLSFPFIVENGGAVVFPSGGRAMEVPGAVGCNGGHLLQLGPPRADLVCALAELATEVGAEVRGFASLAPDEVQALTGLPAEATLHAMRREYDEPFLVEGDAHTVAALVDAAKRRGLRVSHGGRFHHLTGGNDKGLAFRTLLAVYERAGRHFRSVGLGDAETDLSLLQAVERPILVPRRDGSLDPALASALPRAERAPMPGPPGWNEAVLAVLENRELPRGAATRSQA